MQRNSTPRFASRDAHPARTTVPSRACVHDSRRRGARRNRAPARICVHTGTLRIPRALWRCGLSLRRAPRLLAPKLTRTPTPPRASSVLIGPSSGPCEACLHSQAASRGQSIHVVFAQACSARARGGGGLFGFGRRGVAPGAAAACYSAGDGATRPAPRCRPAEVAAGRDFAGRVPPGRPPRWRKLRRSPRASANAAYAVTGAAGRSARGDTP